MCIRDSDSSVFIDRSIEAVFSAIAEAIVLVLLIIFFFPVSYTHLDVYKRQVYPSPRFRDGTLAFGHADRAGLLLSLIHI